MHMAATRREVDPNEIRRLADIRATFAERERKAMEAHPDPDQDSLAALAAYAGAKNGRGSVVGPRWDERYRQLINKAREARMTWREIAEALGEYDENGQPDEQGVADKQRARNKGYERWVHEMGHPPDMTYYGDPADDPLGATAKAASKK